MCSPAPAPRRGPQYPYIPVVRPWCFPSRAVPPTWVDNLSECRPLTDADTVHVSLWDCGNAPLADERVFLANGTSILVPGSVELPAIPYRVAATLEHVRPGHECQPLPTRPYATSPDVWAFHMTLPAGHDPTGSVSFYATVQHAALNRRTTMAVGRYVRRYWSHMTDEQVHGVVSRWRAHYGPVPVHYATTPDAIARVYIDGPGSCMDGTHNFYHLPQHPTSVYGAGDLAVAYMTEDGTPEGTPTARCLVWPDRKVAMRTYGNGHNERDKLYRMLQEAGFDMDGSFEGARVLKAEYRGSFVVPYLDGDYQFTEHRSHLLITSEGEIEGQSTSGTATEQLSCDRCGDSCDPDETSIVDGETWCSHCCDEYAVCCDSCGEYTGDFTTVWNETLCSGCVPDMSGDEVECDGCGGEGPEDSTVTVSLGIGTDGTEYTETRCPGCAHVASPESPRYSTCHHGAALRLLPPNVRVRIPGATPSGGYVWVRIDSLDPDVWDLDRGTEHMAQPYGRVFPTTEAPPASSPLTYMASDGVWIPTVGVPYGAVGPTYWEWCSSASLRGPDWLDAQANGARSYQTPIHPTTERGRVLQEARAHAASSFALRVRVRPDNTIVPFHTDGPLGGDVVVDHMGRAEFQ